MSLEEAGALQIRLLNKGLIDYGEHKKQPQLKLT